MKSFKEFYTEAMSDFKVGQKVKVNLSTISDYVDVAQLGGQDEGVIDSVTSDGYNVKFTNGTIFKIKTDDAYTVN